MQSDHDVKGEGFEIVDHGEPRKPGDEQAGEAASGAAEKPVSVDVYTILRISIAQLAAMAWQMMGLQPDPFTNTVRKDTTQAKIAIDSAAALVDQLKPHIHGQEGRDYQTLLTDLRLNFVSHSQSDTAPPAS